MPSIKPVYSAIRSAAPTSSDTWYSIDGHRGLWLRARPNMPKVWVFRSVVGGTPQKITLGRYPDMDFDAARREMDRLRVAADGANPIAAKRERDDAQAELATATQRAEQLRPTVSTIAERYLGHYVSDKRRESGTKRTADEDRRLFKKYIEPAIGGVKIEELKSKQIAALRDGIDAPSEKRKALAVLRALLSHAKSDGYVEHNVGLGIKTPRSGERRRVLDDDEIRAVWNATPAKVPGVRPEMLDAIRVQLLTGQRAGEVLAMRWDDLTEHQHLWRIRPEVSKNGRENFVPLEMIASRIIQSQPTQSDYVFKGHRATPVSTSSFGQVVDRVRAALGLAHFTSHDLRRTAATRLAGLGTLPHVVEAILNHSGGTISGVAALYNRHTYLHEKGIALRFWEREIDRIAGTGEYSPSRRSRRDSTSNYFSMRRRFKK